MRLKNVVSYATDVLTERHLLAQVSGARITMRSWASVKLLADALVFWSAIERKVFHASVARRTMPEVR